MLDPVDKEGVERIRHLPLVHSKVQMVLLVEHREANLPPGVYIH